MYTRSWKGQLIKFDPRTKAAELLESGLMPSSDSFLAFHPQDDNMLYICYPNKHIIFTYNLLTGEHKPFAGIQNQPGYMDGESVMRNLEIQNRFVLIKMAIYISLIEVITLFVRLIRMEWSLL